MSLGGQMVQKVGWQDEAELRAEFQKHYKEQGFLGCCQVLYEMLYASQILMEVMKENNEKAS